MTFGVQTRLIIALALACLASGIAVTLCISLIQAEDPANEPVIEPRISTEESRLVGPQYPVQAEIIARVLADGRAEFCLRTEEGEFACPRARFINPDRERGDRWIPSSEFSWRVPVDPDRVIYPPMRTEETGGLEAGCAPDFERMMEATWKVETTRARGSGFYIGNGRFVTAHHVIEDVPPFVALTHGDRVVAAQVLGSSPEHDVALLQVFDPSQVEDLPALDFHNPDPSDVGEPVFLVGYPSAGALTVATGVLIRVWDDEILTSSSSLGGNSGGPMFDSCGKVIGVLWAGSSSKNFSHSGEALTRVVEELGARSGRTPIHVPEIALPEGLVIWHYGPQPPEGVDCVGVQGSWWVGVAGPGTLDVNWGVSSHGACTHGFVRVVGLERRPDSQPGPASEVGYGEGPCPGEYGAIQQTVETVLHESTEEFGEATLGRLRTFEWCDVQPTYRLEVSFPSPLNHTLFSAELIGTGGRVTRGFGSNPGRGHYTRGGFVIGFWQDFTTSPGFEPTALRVTVNRENYRVDIEAPPVLSPSDDVNHIEQRARIAVRIDSETKEVVACLRLVGGELGCPTDEQTPLNLEATGWQRLSEYEWHAPLTSADTPRDGTCSSHVQLGEQAWQMTTLGGDGSAVYVGRNQFITADRLFEDGMPWGVVSQASLSVPVARVASDGRNGLALVEVIGSEGVKLPESLVARFAASTQRADTTTAFLVAYPWGDADRLAMTRLRIREVTDRLLEHDGWGWDRAGAPIVDPCTGEVIGLSTGGSEALRAETAVSVLRELRRTRVVPQVPSSGPEIHGSIALLPRPVYLSTQQPDIGGAICNVRDSTRYDVVYAVYLVSSALSEVISVVDGASTQPSRCGWSGKVFMVQYQSDQEPDAICAEPASPSSPRTTLDLELHLLPGVELIQATNFVRSPCPGMRDYPGWDSTHVVKLRFTDAIELDDIEVRLVDSNGERHTSTRQSGDVDPDVRSWRFNLGGSVPTGLIVAYPEQGADVTPAEIAHLDQDPIPPCQEDYGREGYGLISRTLLDARLVIGRVRLVKLGAPVQCPWIHTHGAIVQFDALVPRSTSLSALLIGADGSIIRWHRGSKLHHGQEAETYSAYVPVFLAPEAFEPVAVEIRIGGRRWIAVVR